jgi:RND family efflux transporter MFP subunit
MLKGSFGKMCIGFFGAMLMLGMAQAVWAEDFSGIVYPAHDLGLSLGAGGLVTSVNVKVGQSVDAGQVLLVLDERLANIEVERRRGVWQDNAELRALEERLVIVSELLGNAVKLFEQTGGVSQEEVQKLKLDLSDTRGRVDQIKARKVREGQEFQAAEQERRNLRLLAPVAGVVTRFDLDIGEWAKPGEAVVQMVDTSKCYLRVSVSAQAARSLKTGMRLPVQVEGAKSGAANTTLTGRLSFVSPVADAASGLVELRVEFDNSRNQIRPGAIGRVRLGAR